MIYLVPIEPLEERYSADWYRWFPERLQILGKHVKVIDGVQKSTVIRQGAFLDVIDTNRYKASQIMQIMDLIDEGVVTAKDTFFFLDGWFPGVESLAYVRDALKLKFKMVACFHAGSYDRADRLYQWGTDIWAHPLEQSWFTIYDMIFVATHFHRNLIMATTPAKVSDKIHVTGFPFYRSWKVENKNTSDLVVFPHRLDPEKDPDKFDALYSSMEDVEDTGIAFWKTKKMCKSKEAYYKMLSDAKVAISFAKQETWGIAMQEATALGCLPIVPNRLSYPEIFLREFIYINESEIPNMIINFIYNYNGYLPLLSAQQNIIFWRGASAIKNMVHLINVLEERNG